MTEVLAARPLKLAMVLFRYFPWGGMQINFMRIARACLARGHTVDVYTLDWEGEQPAGLKVNIVAVSGRQNIVRYRRFARQLEGIVAGKDYQLIVGFNRMPGLDLYYAADPCFVERVSKTRPWYYPLTARYRHFKGVEERLFAPQTATRILALSPLQIDEYARNYATPRERFSLLPPAVQPHYRRQDDALAMRSTMRGQYSLTEQDWVVLMIGSGFERKGMDRGLQAVAALPAELVAHCHIFVVGKGREKSLRRRARILGLDERLHIISGTDKVPLYLQGADLLVHPARSENTGNVIVEALAAGLPVLCSAVCGYAEHVTRAEAGRVIEEPFVQRQMDGQLATMLDRDNLKRWQQNALRYARTEDLYSRTERVVELIEAQAEDSRKNA